MSSKVPDKGGTSESKNEAAKSKRSTLQVTVVAEASMHYMTKQTKVPKDYPEILKQYTKAAIRSQPKDLLAWSAAYFRSLADGTKPAMKDKFQLPSHRTVAPTGLTRKHLKQLHAKMKLKLEVDSQDLSAKWVTLGLNKQELETLLRYGGLQQKFPWRIFVALAAHIITKDMNEAMVMVCRVMSNEPSGLEPVIPFCLFRDTYMYLCGLDPEANLDRAEGCLVYLGKVATTNKCSISPFDIEDLLCPRLT